MRICLITPELPPWQLVAGIGNHVLILARGFARKGHQVTVAGLGLHPAARVVHDWGESVSLPFPPGLRGGFDLGRARSTLAVRSFLQERRGCFDIVQCTNFPGYGAFVPVGPFRFVVRLSSPWREIGPFPLLAGYYNALEARTCYKADLLLANSAAALDKAIEYYRCERTPAAVVPLGLPDVDSGGAVPPRDRIAMLYLGRAGRRKGTDLLLRALAEVLPRCPRLDFTFVGCDLDRHVLGAPAIRTVWRDLRARFAGRIRNPGVVSEHEKIRLCASAHWLVAPSRFESFGQMAVEAMRAGTPVIAAASGSLAEVCGTCPENLLYEDAEDLSALVRLMVQACEGGPDFALARRDAARRAYLEHFTDQPFVDRSLEWYQRTLDRARC